MVTGVVTEVVTPQNPLSNSASDTVLPPVTTFSPKHLPNANSVAEARETEDSQPQKSLENRGGNTSPDNAQNLVEQGLQPVTTSQNKGGNTPKTPQCPETAINKHHAGRLADEMRKAIANGDSTEAKEIWGKFENIPLSQRGQQRQFFWKALTPDEKRKASLLIFTNVVEGTPLKYVGTLEQYQSLTLVAYDANGQGGVTCQKPDGYLTSSIPIKDLKKL